MADKQNHVSVVEGVNSRRGDAADAAYYLIYHSYSFIVN